MPFKFIIVFIALLLSSCTTTTGDRHESREPIKNPLLWEIRRPNYPTSYLLGTIHLGISSTELPSIVWEKFKDGDQIVLEADILNVDPELIRESTYLEKGNLRQSLTKSEWEKLTLRLPQIPPTALRKMTSYGVITLIQNIEAQGLGSLDLEILKQAKKDGKYIVFLETAKFQLELINQLITINTLKNFLKQDRPFIEELNLLTKLYREGDVEKIFNSVVSPPNGYMKLQPSEVAKLLDDRNRNWSTLLDPIFRRDKSFIAVGAGHLGGPNGLIKQLTKRGFILKRVIQPKQK